MRNRIDARIGTGLLLGIFTLAGVARLNAAPVGPSSPSPAPAACTVAVQGDVSVASSPVVVTASLTEAIGDSIAASFPGESKIEIASVAPAAPNTVKLTLNTAQAAPGEWTLSLKGTQGVCTGTVKVTPAKQ